MNASFRAEDGLQMVIEGSRYERPAFAYMYKCSVAYSDLESTIVHVYISENG